MKPIRNAAMLMGVTALFATEAPAQSQSHTGEIALTGLNADGMLQGENDRPALAMGIQLKAKLGVNPYQFGFIGSTDLHTGLATAARSNFFGKHSGSEPNADRLVHPMAKIGDSEYVGWSMASSRFAAVWAQEHTRAATFDAMERIETYGTKGPLVTVRFYGGWGFVAEDALGRAPADIGYRKGQPMGGYPTNAPESPQPSFMFAALRDPLPGNLDRVQIVKVWVNADGVRQEKVCDVAWSGGRVPEEDGRLPLAGNTVDVANATWTNSIGSPELLAVWADPDFNPSLNAAYYPRVLEITTPRWTAFEAKYIGIEMDPKAPHDPHRTHVHLADLAPTRTLIAVGAVGLSIAYGAWPALGFATASTCGRSSGTPPRFLG